MSKSIHSNYIQILNKVNSLSNNTTTLITVSKTQTIEAIMEAYQSGCREFGENKVQELVEKIEVLPDDIQWHMIGHLQTNKVKYIIDKVSCIHSVESLKLAKEISKEACKKKIIVPILIEVNIGNEESKFGISPINVIEFIEQVSILPGVKIEGLMTVAPYVENAEQNRELFAHMKQLSVDINMKNIDNVNMNVLSMGMSGDYEVAIQEGATHVRVGTGIFGERYQ